MSPSTVPDSASPIDYAQTADATPITLDADALPATTPTDLREFKQALTDDDLVPTRLVVDTSFETDCSFTIQDEVDRLRNYIRAAAFLGAPTVTVTIDRVATPEKVQPALAAAAERAERDGITLDIEGPLTIST